MEELHWLEIVTRLGLAAVLASLTGLEREWKAKPAGLKTNMLVGLGAATFTVLTVSVVMSMQDQTNPPDPLRTVSGIVGGIGFLGAGSIIQGRGSVRGITTAANIWINGAIGVACGAGLFMIAGIATGMALLILVPLGFIEHRFVRDEDHAKKNEKKKK